MLSGFSWPSTAPVVSAGLASAQLICVGLAPRAVKVSLNSGEPTTRIFRPFRSSGLRIGCFEFETRSEEHTSELQSLMRISYAVFCLKKKNKTTQKYHEMK